MADKELLYKVIKRLLESTESVRLLGVCDATADPNGGGRADWSVIGLVHGEVPRRRPSRISNSPFSEHHEVRKRPETVKIAQIAPLYESVPPKLYGGTERIVSYLTEELVARNHDVTLFASADSVTRARLVPASESALRLSPTPVVDTVAHYIRLLELVFREAHQFDILHFHIDYLHFPFTKRQPVPTVTTLHGKLSIPDLVPLYK